MGLLDAIVGNMMGAGGGLGRSRGGAGRGSPLVKALMLLLARRPSKATGPADRAGSVVGPFEHLDRSASDEVPTAVTLEELRDPLRYSGQPSSRVILMNDHVGSHPTLLRSTL